MGDESNEFLEVVRPKVTELLSLILRITFWILRCGNGNYCFVSCAKRRFELAILLITAKNDRIGYQRLEAAEKRIARVIPLSSKKRLYEDRRDRAHIRRKRFTDYRQTMKQSNGNWKRARYQAELQSTGKPPWTQEKFIDVVRRHTNFEEPTLLRNL